MANSICYTHKNSGNDLGTSTLVDAPYIGQKKGNNVIKSLI